MFANIDKKRIYWGLGLAVFAVLFVFYAPLALFKSFVIVVVALCLKEYMSIALPHHPSSSPQLGVVLGTILSAVILFAKGGSDLWIASLTLLVVTTFVFYLFRKHEMGLILHQIAITVLGCIYIASLFSYVGLMRALDHGVFWVFLVAGATFMSDTGAYFVGHAMGKHKLAPLVSPGKTVEGFVGGVLGSVLATFICKLVFWQAFPKKECVIIGVLIGVIGPLGDLSESLIKRSVDVKDSGQLIPGHGGLLDRVDALLFTAPLVYYYALFRG
ncbi:MAG: phosphatidate cytidylyltransferase [Deltaproteobacteria bacterium]|nr:phosphatidate cytidylyltransferase [Deltaproteobacteria bacterium]